METLHYNVIFRQEPEGGYTALVPSLPGCISYGKTLQQARDMIEDAIGGYLISLRKHGEPVPTDDRSFISSLEVHTPAVAFA